MAARRPPILELVAAVLLLGTVVVGARLARRGEDPSTGGGRLPFHFAEHLGTLPELRSPVLGRRAELHEPFARLDLDAADAVEHSSAGGLSLRRIERDELGQGACAEVKAEPKGRATLVAELAARTGGYVQVEGKIRIHTSMRGDELAQTMREVRRLPQVWLRALPAPAGPSIGVHLEPDPGEAVPGGTTLLPGEGAIGIKSFAAWQPFAVPVRLPAAVARVRVELVCDVPFAELRFDDLALRVVEPLAAIEDVGRYRYAKDTEATAPVLKMIHSDHDDRLSVLFVPGSKMTARVQLAEGSRLDLNALMLAPQSLAGEPGGEQELCVRAIARSGAQVSARHRLPRDDAALRTTFQPLTLDLAPLGSEEAEITIESPAPPGAAALDPPFLFLGDPVVHAPRPPGTRPAGVLILTLDALSCTHLSGNGYPRATTPILDRLAGEGAFFLHCAAAAPSTYTSLPSMLTSAHRRDSWSEFLTHLESEAVTLPEVFGAQGYTTEVFLRDIYFNSFWKGVAVRPYPYTRAKLSAEAIDYETTDRLIAWLKTVHTERFFAWMHLNMPHGPNRPAPAHDRFRDEPASARAIAAIQQFMTATGVPGARGVEETAEQISLHHDRYDAELVAHARTVIGALYDASIHEGEALLERVIDALREMGLLDDTLIAISSDHGWPLVPEFEPEKIAPDAAYEVPLILRGPGVPAGRRIGERVSLVDLAPTLLDLAGLEAPPSFEGWSLRPLLHGGTLGLRLIAAQNKDSFLGYLGSAKLVVPRGALGQPVGDALAGASFFDLALDPDGKAPRPARGDELAVRVYDRLVAWHAAPQIAFGAQRPLTEAMKGFLREAGYLKDDK